MTDPQQWKGVGMPEICEKDKLNVAWWYNWAHETGHDMTYVPMSWGGEDISNIVSSRPVGSYYMIYNEPDVPNQANEDPNIAAGKYFDTYNRIRHEDATAKIGGIGLVYIAADGHCDEASTPPPLGGQDYLAAFLDQLKWKNFHKSEFPPYHGENLDAKFDFYHVHAYRSGPYGFGGAVNSAGTAITFERLRKHIDWLHGALHNNYGTEIPANVPVWITETSELGGSAGENVVFMRLLWHWLNSWGFGIGLIERVAWFATRSGFSGTNLFEADLSTLTNLGGKWREASMAVGEFRQLVVAVTGNGTRYRDYVWSHGMGAAPSGVAVSIGMTGVGRFWGVNTYNPSSTQVRFRVFHVDGENWTDTLTLTALGWWA